MGNGVSRDVLYTPEQYNAKCAEAAMLQEAASALACYPTSFTLPPQGEAEQLIIHGNGGQRAFAALCRALAASTDGWLERHDEETKRQIREVWADTLSSKDAEIDGMHNAMAKRGQLLDAALAKLEKAEAERDGYAAALNQALIPPHEDRTLQWQYGYVTAMREVAQKTGAAERAAHLARIKHEARKAALLEAATEAEDNLRFYSSAVITAGRLRDMAGETPNA